MRNIRVFLFLMLGIVTYFAFDALAFGADSNVPAKEQSRCSPAQFMAWIYTMGTCISLEFKDAIIEKHITHGISNGIFQNISGSSELNKVCLRCHIRVKQKLY